MPVRLRGGAISADAEVENLSKALRITPRPIDYGGGGSYQLTSKSGTMAEDISADAPIYAFRVASALLVVPVRRIWLNAWTLMPVSPFVESMAAFDVFRATAWTAPDTGGVTDVITTDNGKLRTSMASIAALAEIRHASTAALSAGTRTLGAQAVASRITNLPNTANYAFFSDALFERKASEYPLVLEQEEGFVIQATMPNDMTWGFSVTVQWDELSSYEP